jgi:nucleoside-diphosphate-sugar epimerase
VWGLGKVIALEHPEHLGGMIDLSGEASPTEPAEIVHELLHGDGEDLVAFRDDDRLVARLTPRHPRSRSALVVRSDATYLVTGGLGALGRAILQWLIERGARHVCVVGRRGLVSDEAREAVRRYQDAGVDVHVVAADIGDPARTRRLFAELHAHPPLRGIVHAAGVPASGPLDQLDPAGLPAAFRAKISGTWLLHELTRHESLDFFVLCSSMVAVWGAKGQADYIAANAFLDACAHYRRALKLPALSIDWGPLEGGGMLPSDAIAALARMGVATRPIADTGAIVGDLLQSDAVQTVVADIDWRLFRPTYEVRGRRPMFDDVPADSIRDATSRPPAAAGPLVDAPASERRSILRDVVERTLADVLGLTRAQISDPRMGFFNLGMDSLTAMEFRDRLEASLGVSLPATVALDYSTVETLAGYLLTRLPRLEPEAPPASASDAGTEADAAARLQHLSDEEVEAMLLRKLDTL